MRSSKLLWILAVTTATAFVAAGTTGCASGRAASAAASETEAALPSIPVVRADAGRLETAIELTGNLAPETRVDIRAKMPGTLEAVLVQLGASVAEGQALATLDRRDIDAQVDAAVAAVAVVKASVDAADAALENAGQEVERARTLYEKGAIPKQRLEAAETQWRASKAQRDLASANVEQANAALRRARELQRDATLRSPVAGVIVARNFDAGSLVGPGSEPIVAVADLRTLKLEAGVSELEAGRLKLGAPAHVTVQAQPGTVFDGRVSAVAPEVDARNRHFRVEIKVANTGRAMLSGMYATARIPLAAAEGPIVPREAVFDRDGGRAVYRVQGDVVSLVRVTEGLSDGKRVVLTSGVQAGDTIVADARREVIEGSRVRAIQSQ
ncbi:MAG TPA: efflux RND transporter periplasmic adaptor subunit [Vicinamibacterales bacterium]|nr:efflux RND transporter periplasmic adaptor subunit [Vicinamibacterales bacterium]